MIELSSEASAEPGVLKARLLRKFIFPLMAAISLTSGKVRFAVHDLQEFRDKRFRVKTRTAVVGSRDTNFIVAYDRELPGDGVRREGLATALCLENSIVVISFEFPDKPALLTANMISQVYGPNLPTPPRYATSAESARIRAGLDQIGNTKINVEP